MTVSKKEQRKLLSVYNEIEEVLCCSKCKGNKRLKVAMNILDDMIDEDVFQE